MSSALNFEHQGKGLYLWAEIIQLSRVQTFINSCTHNVGTSPRN